MNWRMAEGGMDMLWKVAILTASDKGSRGEREDTSAQVIRELVEEELHGEVVEYRIVPDEVNDISASLIEMADYFQADLIITTGGNGLAPRDVTPEATMKVIDKEVPGLAEAMRYAAMQRTRKAMLSRAVCGIRGKSLIINLPASPKGVHDHLLAIIDQLPHALYAVSGNLSSADEFE
ncbi:molybdenum cofactor synthesis domain-containing protein [Paenibacillus alvei A6-6i-x]|nr:molybdenum cofactor synthesis domain-containing protein [Paenibacillus alvei A6-6i-x]